MRGFALRFDVPVPRMSRASFSVLWVSEFHPLVLKSAQRTVAPLGGGANGPASVASWPTLLQTMCDATA